MAALLDRADQMASMDWRVAPVPWRERLASLDRPLKVFKFSFKRSAYNLGWFLH